MRHAGGLAIAATLALLCAPDLGLAQGPLRRLTTIDALRQFPGYYHLQNVLVRGEFAENGRRISLKADEAEIGVQFGQGVTTSSGQVEVRGQLIDVGRLDPGDPRAGSFVEGRDGERWPRPGEELFLQVTAVSDPQTAPTITVRALALDPWRYLGQTVTIIGNFRGRNLFGDLPDAPGKSRYDFVLRGGEGAVWVTGLRPRGSGFDLDVDRRVDTNRWVEVTGPVVHDRGLVRIEATRIVLARTPPPQSTEDAEPAGPAVVRTPADVIFYSPSEGETDVSPTTPVRVQFSKGLAEASLAGRVTASYVGGAAGDGAASLPLRATYDGANRAIEIRFAQPLEPFRTVKVEFADGITAFDGAAVTPWSVTFSVGN